MEKENESGAGGFLWDQSVVERVTSEQGPEEGAELQSPPNLMCGQLRSQEGHGGDEWTRRSLTSRMD